MYKFISLILLSIGLISNINIQAATSVANPQTTATLVASCAISVQNLSFGNLVLPLSAQSTSTNMSILCNNKASYTVGLAYGGVYGTGSTTTTPIKVTLVRVGNPQPYAGRNYCTFTGTYDGKTYTDSYSIGDASCLASEQIVENVPTSVSYNYGKMTGVAKGDTIGYSIQVPGNPGEVWNAGENNYTATGNGIIQSIPVVGSIVPSQSGSSYPTPDNYMDTVTATVSF